MPTAHFPGVLNRLRNNSAMVSNVRIDLREWGTIHDTIAKSKSIAHLWHKETAIDGKKSLLDDVARYDAKSCTWKCMQVLRILGSMLQCHENRILAVGESDDNDTRIANGYNSHSVTSNNGVCTTECTCIISCNPVALIDIFNSMPFQYKQSSIRCVRHSINRRTISNRIYFACVRETFDPRRGCDTKLSVWVNSRLRFLTSSSFVSPELRQAIVEKKVASIDHEYLGIVEEELWMRMKFFAYGTLFTGWDITRTLAGLPRTPGYFKAKMVKMST